MIISSSGLALKSVLIINCLYSAWVHGHPALNAVGAMLSPWSGCGRCPARAPSQCHATSLALRFCVRASLEWLTAVPRVGTCGGSGHRCLANVAPALPCDLTTTSGFQVYLTAHRDAVNDPGHSVDGMPRCLACPLVDAGEPAGSAHSKFKSIAPSPLCLLVFAHVRVLLPPTGLALS